jgi:hypothetical protein
MHVIRERQRHIARWLVAASAVATAAATAVALGPAASAAPTKPSGPTGPTGPKPNITRHVSHYTPAKNGGFRTESGSSGASSGDFTGDGAKDILVRHQPTGDLRVYPHSGTYNGLATYTPAVTINFGWNGLRWIGQGRFAGNTNGTPRNLSDVISIGTDGRMIIYPHSGTFNGTSTLRAPSVVVGFNWWVNDLVFVYDINADGWDDILARRQGTGDTYVYRHSAVFNGTSTFLAPELVTSGGETDLEQNMADVTGDGSPDLLFLQPDGFLSVFSFTDGPVDPVTGKPLGQAYALGYGWNSINAITLTDIDRNGKVDVLGRVTANGNLQAYTNTGLWDPNQFGQAYGTFRVPVVIGFQWQINDVIT